MNKILKIAHRGASGYAPENTLAAFQKAIELGADMIEFDVSLTKDKRLIVMHDLSVDRTTNGQGFIRDLTLKQIKKLKTENGEEVPTLEEVLDGFGQKIDLNIELKSKNIAELVVPLIQKKGLISRVLISSFFHDEVKKVKEIDPNIKTAILLFGVPVKPENLVDWVIKAKADGANLEYEFVTKDYIDALHKNNFFINIFTVNDPREITLMKEMGVDGIISNYPDRI